MFAGASQYIAEQADALSRHWERGRLCVGFHDSLPCACWPGGMLGPGRRHAGYAGTAARDGITNVFACCLLVVHGKTGAADSTQLHV